MSEEQPNHCRTPSSRRQVLCTAAALAGGVFGAGRATGQQETEILTWYDLDAVRDAPAEDYVLGTDLNATTPSYLNLITNRTGGWQPIDTFDGFLRGDGHEIADLMTNRRDLVGLFGTNRGVIEELNLTNCSVRGHNQVGSLAGQNNGSIRCVSTAGTISGRRAVGGLVGITDGTDGRGIIRDSAARCAVGGQRDIGGLVGAATAGSRLAQSAASGRANGAAAVGGFVGSLSDSAVRRSFATGSATANAPGAGGGLVGVAGQSQDATESTVH